MITKSASSTSTGRQGRTLRRRLCAGRQRHAALFPREQGVIHGDRFQIGDLDPNRPGLEGYGIQQSNPSGLLITTTTRPPARSLRKHYWHGWQDAASGDGCRRGSPLPGLRSLVVLWHVQRTYEHADYPEP